MPAVADMHHARQLWDYLRLGIPVRPADCLLVFGGHDLGVAGRAAELYEAGIAPFIVVSGGSRAVPDGTDFATEAEAIADVLLRRDIPKDAIALRTLGVQYQRELLAVRRTAARPRHGPAELPRRAQALCRTAHHGHRPAPLARQARRGHLRADQFR